MEEKEFILKYGDLQIRLFSLYKHRLIMKNDEHKIRVSGTLDYRSDITESETIASFFNEVEDFNFEIDK